MLFMKDIPDVKACLNLAVCLCDKYMHQNSSITFLDPEFFFRWGPTLTKLIVLFLKGGSKYYYKGKIIDPPAKRHLNGVSLACQ